MSNFYLSRLARQLTIAAIASGAAISAWSAEPDWDAVEVQTHDLGSGIYMLQGRGGNLGVSTGADGVFLIDDDYAPLADKIKAAIRALADQPVEYLVNTHWHGDHTGGNAAFHASGSRILAHDNVRTRMAAKSPAGALPELTFSDTATLHFNGHEIHVFHVQNAHTDGDAIVHFKDLNIIHTGDVMFNGRYPYIDLGSGGSVSGYIDALKLIQNLSDAKTRIIPGHGKLATRKDVGTTIQMLSQARKAVAELVDKGATLAATKAAKPLQKFDADYAWAFITSDVFTEILYNDLRAQ